MKKLTLTITNEIGIHARPASMFVKEAGKYASNISVLKDNDTYTAKSILDILRMSAAKGDVITIEAQGSDEAEAIEGLKHLFETELA